MYAEAYITGACDPRIACTLTVSGGVMASTAGALPGSLLEHYSKPFACMSAHLQLHPWQHSSFVLLIIYECAGAHHSPCQGLRHPHIRGGCELRLIRPQRTHCVQRLLHNQLPGSLRQGLSLLEHPCRVSSASHAMHIAVPLAAFCLPRREFLSPHLRCLACRQMLDWQGALISPWDM